MFEAGARPYPPRQLYRSYLSQSHVFVGLYWQRYGWMAPGEEVSGLEDEYRLSEGMPRLIYLKEPAPERDDDLERLLDRIRDDDTASYRRFSTPTELETLVANDLAVLLTEGFEAAFSAPSETAGPRAYQAPPIPATPMIGRADIVSTVADLVTAGPSRLVTITGPGGVGKTRIGIEVAAAAREHFSGGVAFAPLETVGDPKLVPAAIAGALHIGEGPTPLIDQVVEHLRSREVLLVLDNAEQVVESTAAAIGRLLDVCPSVRVLVTSRRPLRLRGEQEFPLEPLPPEDAAALFVDRARARRPDFATDEAGRLTIDRLCLRLDRLPLAIELAAARTPLLGLTALEQRLGPRLEGLGEGPADLPERQRSLRATLEWSYRLLDDDQQALLDRLAVFEGGASFEAIDAICGGDTRGDLSEALGGLLENALLFRTEAAAGPRLWMQQTMHAYALERLTESGHLETMRHRHAVWFDEFAKQGDFFADHPGAAVLERMEEEAANLRLAVAWVVERGDSATVASLARSLLYWYYQTGRVQEMQDWVDRGLALAEQQADADAVNTLEAVKSTVAFFLGDYPEAVDLAERILRTGAEGDVPETAAHLILAVALPHFGRLEDALVHATAARELLASRPVTFAIVCASILGALTALVTGDGVAARELHRESLELAERLGLAVYVAQGHTQLAILDVVEGRFDDAVAHLREAAPRCRMTGNLEGTAYTLDVTAAWAMGIDRPAAALRALTAAEGARNRSGLTIWPLMTALRDSTREVATARLGGERAAELQAESEARDPWDLLDECLGTSNDVALASVSPGGEGPS